MSIGRYQEMLANMKEGEINWQPYSNSDRKVELHDEYTSQSRTIFALL